MSVVFILGAGASTGERFGELARPAGAPPVTNAPPPLLSGFFRSDLYRTIGYSRETAEKDYPSLFQYIRSRWLASQEDAEATWDAVNIEEVFTHLELEREFTGLESDLGARLMLVRNSLLRYIQRILGFCTDAKYGEYSRRLVQAADQRRATIITFNWDLLIDLELTEQMANEPCFRLRTIYNNFLNLVLHQEVDYVTGRDADTPMFLKMHGSLNWLQCTNSKCPQSATVDPEFDIQASFFHAEGIDQKWCKRCGSEMIPWLIPPVLRKPITDSWLPRAIWGVAKARLETAATVVIIGFSAAPTDFYARWLLRSTVGLRKNVRVFVVNRSNGEQEFRARMQTIFPYGYNADFAEFRQIDDVLQRIG